MYAPTEVWRLHLNLAEWEDAIHSEVTNDDGAGGKRGSLW